MVMAEEIYPMGPKRTQLWEKINNNNNYNNNNNNHPLIATHNLYRVKQRKRKRLSAVLDKLHVHNNNVTHYTNNNHQDDINYNIKCEPSTDDLYLRSTPDMPEHSCSRTPNLGYQLQIKAEALPNASDSYFQMISQNNVYLNTQNLDETTNSVMNLIKNPQRSREEPLIYYPEPQEYPLDLSMKSFSRFQETQLNFMHVSIIKGGVASNKIKDTMAARYKINVSPVIEEMPPGSSSSDMAYICPICGQMFSLHDRLAKHIASRHKTKNSGSEVVKSYVCDVCNRSFARSDMLTRHFRLHSGSKPYSCNSCGQVNITDTFQSTY
jgi:DNA-directed RNA polymerase subunit RPC12/RpoP